MQLSVRVRRIPKVVLETCKPTLEAGRILLRQARAADSGSALLVGARGGCLLGDVAQHHRRDRSGPQIRLAVDALELEETCDATVVLLGQRAYLPRAYDSDEAGLLEDLQVVADGALRHVHRSRELGGARRALAEEPDDPAAREVTKGAELESALWSALRTLEENAELRRRMAKRASEGKLAGVAKQYQQAAADAEKRAQVIRQVLLSEREGNGDPAANITRTGTNGNGIGKKVRKAASAGRRRRK